MPLLRARELGYIVHKAHVHLALCDADLATEIHGVQQSAESVLRRVVEFSGDGTEDKELERIMARVPATAKSVETSADDVCLIAFTSGTTGQPKGTMHFHRDLLAVCDTFSKHVLKPEADDVFCGSPPLAFTFGLGGLVLFPFRVGAGTLLIERPAPEELAKAIAEHKPTVCFTAPTAYRLLAQFSGEHDLSSLKKCVSAGETLPVAIFEAFKQATGIEVIDGIGSTEMLHIFIAASGADIRPGATGLPVPGYEAKIVDEDMNDVPDGEIGRLAVRGPTGCRYLADDRQVNYVRDGWNLTGDAYKRDANGYFWFQARSDDMIISAGYNISGPEVEDALLSHHDVHECAVVGAPDEDRGQIVKAFVVLAEGVAPSEDKAKDLQNWVKGEIAPYKYPRAIEFVDTLPRTETGKIQRFRLRKSEEERTGSSGAGA
jgi:2-aminobenzoate-CoA ligase